MASPPRYAWLQKTDDQRFAESVGYTMGSKNERYLALLCPPCAADRMRATSAAGDEICYVETLHRAGRDSRCAGCGAFPLVLTAAEQLTPDRLLHFMGLVLKMAEREARRSVGS